MNTGKNATVYDETYRFYLQQLKKRPFEGKETILGVVLEDRAVVVPYFGEAIRLTDEGLQNEAGHRPDFADCVVICRYLIQCPPFESGQTEWTAYRDFPDAGPLTVFWSDSVEGPLANRFSGGVEALRKSCDTLDGTRPELDIACDLCRRFTPLPKVPLLLIFNDADEEFPASASLLFEKRSATYLDGESQAILGHILSKRIIALCEKEQPTPTATTGPLQANKRGAP